MTAAELTGYLAEVFPQTDPGLRIDAVAPMRATLSHPITERHLRPGGTVSGPTMFALADVGFYVAILAMVGREPLTVTTNLSINFLRKPSLEPLSCEARLLKLGRTLVVGDVTLFSGDAPEPVAHASATYARSRG
ncbi:MAG: PaaI family thioesterase [Rhodobacteraceae bacterium]|nr:PaaI family thioesterase [Paracoccaceae bacterium]